MEAGESDLGTTRVMSLGDELVVRLPENPSTGFRWQLVVSGDGELTIVDDHFEPGGNRLPPGSAGTRVVRYRSTRTGTVQLQAENRRVWEPSGGTPRVLTIRIG